MFPGIFDFRPAEVAVGRAVSVDRPQQVQVLDDGLRTQVEMLLDQGLDSLLRHRRGTKSVDHQRYRLSHADRIGNLYLTSIRQAGGNNILGDVSKGIRGRPVDLRGILPGERAAAMVRGPAVGIDDDLTPGESAVADRPSHHESAGGIHQVPGLAADHTGRQDRLDDFLDHGIGQFFVADVGRMLGRQHHGIHRYRLAVLVAYGDLRLGVGSQPFQFAGFSDNGLLLDQAMCVVDGEGHKAVGLITGVTKHQPLVTGSLVQVQTLALVDPLGDVGRLLVERYDHRTGIGIKPHLGRGVTDFLNGFAGDRCIVRVRFRGDFAGENDHAGVDHGFARDPRCWISFKKSIEDGVRDLVCDLVRMSLGDGFRCKYMAARHEC